MHTDTHVFRSSPHLVVGTRRPPARATAGPYANDELFGLIFCHLGSHTLEVIGYEVGPLASNPTFTTSKQHKTKLVY